MSQPAFIHLRVHSEYSLIDSVITIKDLIAQVSALDMPAVALTDQCNFFGLIKFYKACHSAGIKPIIGCDFYVLEENGQQHLLTLLAMNNTGYKNITELISKAYLQEQHQGVAYILPQWLAQFNQGVIALSGAKFGDVGQELCKGNSAQAEQKLAHWMALYPGCFYLELQRTGRQDDENYVNAALQLAEKLQCPVVASNDVRFINADAYEAHETRVCIHDGVFLDNDKRVKRYSAEQYLRSTEEMCALFADIPSALENTVEIAKQCNVSLQLGTYFLPEYPIPEGMTQDAFFRQVSHDGLTQRLKILLDSQASDYAEQEKRYRDRLDFELNTILQMGFPGYFLIVMDFIAEAKKQGIPVGPGRGSGAGSLVAYSLKITDLDPLAYDLLFERFLNPERVSMPDFDIDFCMDRRGEVIQYVAHKYGEMAVSQIATFGTMAAKAVIRDVARVQGKPYGLADKLSKMIPFEVGMTLSKALQQEPSIGEFISKDEAANEIWQMAQQLEGTVRNVGKHAGGVVIAPNKITDFSPLCSDEEGEGKVTQFDKDDVEAAGLVKFDFLGLRTLTIIDWAIKIINARQTEQVDITHIPLDDEATFSLLKSAETTAVFQLESSGMKDLIKRLQPDNIEDLIALVALFRPGPLDSGMVDDFVNRKHGRAPVAYPDATYQHEWLKPILEPTYGVIVYQEQVMQIAQVLAGYSLGGADLLRRAMGKKKPEEMAKQRETFSEGAQGQGIDPELAMKIFDLVEKFAGYGFNKSHSAAYALVSYQTAWLKTHYPAPFMAAVLSSELHNTDKIVIFINECKKMALVVRPPDVNDGQYHFTVNGQGEIVYGLGAIKGLGEGPVSALIDARSQGKFTDLFDFCARVDVSKMNKRSLEALVRSGAFDSLNDNRAMLLEAMTEASKSAEQNAFNQAAGIDDLFADIAPIQTANVYQNFQHILPWTLKERLTHENSALGLYLTGHPMDEYQADLPQLNCKRLGNIYVDKELQWLAGIVAGRREIRTKRGDKLLILTLDDGSAQLDVTVFSQLLEQVHDKIKANQVVFIQGKVEEDSYSGGLRVRAEAVLDMAEMRRQAQSVLCLHIDEQNWHASNQALLESLLNESDEGCTLVIKMQHQQLSAQLKLPKTWRIVAEEEHLQQLKRQFGSENVSFLSN